MVLLPVIQILQGKHTRPATMPFESKVKTNENSGVVMPLTSDSTSGKVLSPMCATLTLMGEL